MIETWNLQPTERVVSVNGAIPYIAACPCCNNDAKWRDVMVSIVGTWSGSRTAIQPDITCDYCGPLDVQIEVEP